MTYYIVANTVNIFFKVLTGAILVYCVLTWFPAVQRTGFFRMLSCFVEPLTAPFRGISMWIMRRTGIPLDFSLLFALIAVRVLENVAWRLILFIF